MILLVYLLFFTHRLASTDQRVNYWFFLRPWYATTTMRYIALIVVVSVSLWTLYRWRPKSLGWILLGGLLFSQTLLGITASKTLNGKVPWGFDHPSFMYRLYEFTQVFPKALGGYNPDWNAGIEHFVGVTSGAHAYGILNWPVIKFVPIHRVYGPLLILWFIFLFPWLGIVCLRAAGSSWIASLLAGFALLGASRGVFMWMWHFGTAGAATSSMMVVPFCALAYRIAVRHRTDWPTILCLALSAWLLCLWSPGFLVCAGMLGGWLLCWREWEWRSNVRLVVSGTLALLLLLPWIWATWFPCRTVVHYVATGSESIDWLAALARGTRRLATAVNEWHPCVAVYGILGALWAASSSVRRWVIPGLLLLGLITGWSREIKPFSQLDRMAIPMAMLAVVPMTDVFDTFGKLSSNRGSLRAAWVVVVAEAVVISTLAMGVRSIRFHYANENLTPLRVLPAEIERFVEWIRENVPKDGRLGFANRTVHAYGGGNIAYLPVLAGREMMADDYYGFPRGTIEMNYPPSYYRQSLERYMFFTRAYGITHWTTAIRDTYEFLASHTNEFELCYQFPLAGIQIGVFRVKYDTPPSRFWKGTGRVHAKHNQLEIYLDDPHAEAVLRYNWRGGLYSRTRGAEIYPVQIDENLRFIGIRPNGCSHIVIGYKPKWAPLEPNFDGRFHH